MEEFIKLISQQLNVDSSTANKATAHTMNYLKEQVEPSLFDELIKKIPGLEAILAMMNADSPKTTGQAESKTETKKEDAGLFGSLSQIAGAVLGKEAAQGLDLVNKLKDLGLSMEDITKFLSALFEWLKKNVSAELITKILQQLPALAKMMK